MERPDLRTLACVNPECQQFRQAGQGNLVIRKVYGPSGTMGPIDYATSVRRVRHWPFPKQTGITAAPDMHHGGLQSVGPVARLPAQRVGLRSPLDSGI